MKRRDFLKVLSAVPVVGAVGTSEAKPIVDGITWTDLGDGLEGKYGRSPMVEALPDMKRLNSFMADDGLISGPEMTATEVSRRMAAYLSGADGWGNPFPEIYRKEFIWGLEARWGLERNALYSS